ncbi:MAG: uroporphyrinogen decarboxylase family protein [Anaerolineaceae bacterium]|nr:uroporphyrinogen decarboxylase family protein [Anaerolineaceae bacterium]
MAIEGMSGKELLFRALRHEPVSAVPWVPYAGVHAGKLKGYSGEEILKDGKKLLESLLAVNEVYDPDGQPIVFDLQVEAEIMGCELIWTGMGPPLIGSHPLAGKQEIPTRLPQKDEGRLPMILDVMRKMKTAVGNKTALYGLVTGPMTLASHLRGTEIFMDMVRRPDQFKLIVTYVRDIAKEMIDFYLEAGMDVIAIVDPLASQISPKQFAQTMSEPYQYLFDYIRAKGAFSSFFVCGDATKNVEVMCQTGPDSIAVDENLNMITTKQITDRYNITLGGNIPLTTKMLLGTQQDNMKFVVDYLDKIDHHNLILAPGCDVPYDTPIENVVGCLQAVRNPEETKKMLANYSAPQLDLDSVIIPDYKHLARPMVEVFTLDSATCAACTYMLGAVKDASTDFGSTIDVVEYKFTLPENVARVVKMGVSNLPSVYINGELKYSSLIPSRQELVDEIKKSF